MDGGKIGLLDFGVVGGLTHYERKEGVKLYVYLVNRDIEGVIKQLLKLGKLGKETDMDSFKREVDDVISGWYGTELRQVRVTHMLHQLFDSCLKHDIELPVSMLLFGKALVTVEGTGMMLNPRFNFVKESHKYVSKYVKRKAITKESFNVFLKKSQKITETLGMIPTEALAVIQKLKQGVIKIDIEDSDLSRLAHDIDKGSNRLSYAMIMASLIIGGALTMHANASPLVGGVSFPAMVMYLIAGFVGMTLLVSILKEGNIWR
jgi:ubiquinone biosynthesis protein